MPKGPPPKPTALKELAGNPGKRRIKGAEPTPDPVVLPAPDYMDDRAKWLWRSLVPELVRHGLFARLYREALAAYCVSWSRHVKAEMMIQKQSEITNTPNGMEVSSAWLNISNRAQDNMRRWSSLFGLTPADMTRMAGAAQAELPFNGPSDRQETDPWANLN
jgi:P27 family predicted phage terminase small subunit